MSRTRQRVLNVLIPTLAIVGFAVFMIVRSGLFDKNPTVEAVADNCYTETLRVITDEDYSPYSFYDANGNFSGYDVELVTLLANKLQMNLDLKFMPWNEGIASIIDGKADILMTCDYSDSFGGVEKLDKSEATSYDDFIVYANHRITTISSLYGKKIAIMENGNVTPQMELLGLMDFCVTYPDNREAMRALMMGEVDYAVMRQAVGATLLKELNLNPKTKAYISAGMSYMCFGIYIEDTELADRINKGLEELKFSGETDRLRDKWLTTFVRPYTIFEVLLQNFWLAILLFVFIAASIAYFVSSKQKELIDREEKEKAELERQAETARDAAVIAGLSDDFGCVLYVNTDNGHEYHYRFDSMLAGAISNWTTIKYFQQRLKTVAEAVVHPDDKPLFKDVLILDNIKEEVSRHRVFYQNFRIVIDGQIRYYQAKFVQDENSDNHIIAGLRNVDEAAKREMEYQAKLEAANKSKTDFLFNMSHDIRTPMNAIIGFTQMAKKHIDDSGRVADSLNKIEASGNHLLDLINEVLDMSRVEAGKLRSEMKTVNVPEAAMKLVSICQESANQGGVSLSFTSKNIIHPVVIADELHVNQIVMNILGNAIKYTKPGGSVNYTIEELNSEVPGYGKYVLAVKDTGIGMSEEFLTKIFDSFSREESAETSVVQGTGLGMAIVKRLVDYMDGQIDVKSEQGKGTVVTVTIHMKLADVVAAEESAGISADVVFEGKRALLVEDNEMNREIAGMILEEQGIGIETAVNGIEAVEKVKFRGVEYYDFILMDVQMPLMDGFEATKEIRKLPGSADLPIIALSANAFEEDKRRSLEAGMNDHVAKPIVVEDLMKTIAKYVK